MVSSIEPTSRSFAFTRDHQTDILGKKPKTDAKADLYNLFDQLGKDFNGDLRRGPDAESCQIKVEHIEILN